MKTIVITLVLIFVSSALACAQSDDPVVAAAEAQTAALGRAIDEFDHAVKHLEAVEAEEQNATPATQADIESRYGSPAGPDTPAPADSPDWSDSRPVSAPSPFDSDNSNSNQDVRIRRTCHETQAGIVSQGVPEISKCDDGTTITSETVFIPGSRHHGMRPNHPGGAMPDNPQKDVKGPTTETFSGPENGTVTFDVTPIGVLCPSLEPCSAQEVDIRQNGVHVKGVMTTSESEDADGVTHFTHNGIIEGETTSKDGISTIDAIGHSEQPQSRVGAMSPTVDGSDEAPTGPRVISITPAEPDCPEGQYRDPMYRQCVLPKNH